MPIELIATLVGVILGFVLSEGVAWLRDCRQTRRMRKVVRTLLRLETYNNLDLMVRYRGTFKPYLGATDGAATQRAAREFATRALPPWSKSAWESQLPEIPHVLREHEARGLALLHSTFDGLVLLRASARDLLAIEESQPRPTQPVPPQ